jgi:hypothetical protein
MRSPSSSQASRAGTDAASAAAEHRFAPVYRFVFAYGTSPCTQTIAFGRLFFLCFNYEPLFVHSSLLWHENAQCRRFLIRSYDEEAASPSIPAPPRAGWSEGIRHRCCIRRSISPFAGGVLFLSGMRGCIGATYHLRKIATVERSHILSVQDRLLAVACIHAGAVREAAPVAGYVRAGASSADAPSRRAVESVRERSLPVP